MASTSSTRSVSPAGPSRVHAISPQLKTPAKLMQLSSIQPLAVHNLSPVAPSLTSSPTGTSVQSSPDALQARAAVSHCPTPLQLPDSAISSPLVVPQQAHEPSPSGHAKPGLIRRVSRSAMNAPNRLLRSRQSSNNVVDRYRDQSSGPLVMRRQSSATNSTVDHESFDMPESFQLPDNILNVSTSIPEGLSTYAPSGPPSAPAFTKPWADPDNSYVIVNEGVVDKSLQKGTKLLKITRKKDREFTFALDPRSVKISWHPTDSTKRLYVDDILEIRLRSEARINRQELDKPEEWENRWFTIIYTDPNRSKGRQSKSMHLLAPDEQTFEKWTTNLLNIIQSRQNIMQGLSSGRQDNYDKILPELWRREMAKLAASNLAGPKPDAMDLLGVRTVSRSLHMDCNHDWLKNQFNRADVRRVGKLTYDEFRTLFNRLKERPEIIHLYNTIREEGAEGLSQLSFFGFLRIAQGVDITGNEERWAKVFDELAEPVHGDLNESPASSSPRLMSLEGFCTFLGSSVNDTLKTITTAPKLDQPLSQYFISSSHNTYLMGRQVAGVSSTEAYTVALKKGCRCVEIDCWDGEDGRPVVTHGRTMTSSVPFQDCISIIERYAFIKSEYPLILSLEVHCNPAQQQIMTDIMVSTLGEKLVKTPINDLRVLPSPEELKYRILIKVKASSPDVTGPPSVPTTPAHTHYGHTRRQRSMSSPQVRQPLLANDLPPLSSPPTLASLDLQVTSPVAPRPSISSSIAASSTDESDAPFSPGSTTRTPVKLPKSKIIKNLGELGAYTSGYKFRGFAYNEARHFNHVFSLAEGDFEALCRDTDSNFKVEKHNAKYFMRVYPGKKRIRSSNFNPLLAWRKGVQMAALNWQTYDLGMQLNDAMFASQADSRGYVLKPSELRSGLMMDKSDDTLGQLKGQKQHIRFSLELISGQQLPRPRSAHPDTISSPYVDIELLCAEDKKIGIATGEGGQDASRSGAAGIGAPHRRRSKIVEKNGYNPQFDDTFRLSLETRYPSLVFVRWSVWSSPDGKNPVNNANAVPLATFTAKLSDLEQGYRYLPLYDNQGEKLFSTLFCRIMKDKPISVDGFGRDDRNIEKTGRLRNTFNVLKRTLSNSNKEKRGVERRSSAATSRRQSRDRHDQIHE